MVAYLFMIADGVSDEARANIQERGHKPKYKTINGNHTITYKQTN